MTEEGAGSMSRRDFLKVLGLGGAGFLLRDKLLQQQGELKMENPMHVLSPVDQSLARRMEKSFLDKGANPPTSGNYLLNATVNPTDQTVTFSIGGDDILKISRPSDLGIAGKSSDRQNILFDTANNRVIPPNSSVDSAWGPKNRLNQFDVLADALRTLTKEHPSAKNISVLADLDFDQNKQPKGIRFAHNEGAEKYGIGVDPLCFLIKATDEYGTTTAYIPNVNLPRKHRYDYWEGGRYRNHSTLEEIVWAFNTVDRKKADLKPPK